MRAIRECLFLPGEVSATSPQSWAKETNLAALDGKKINLCSEMPRREILASEIFKAVIAGDQIMARSLYKNPYPFSPKCGHIFAANELPAIDDHTTGFWRRSIIIKFNQDFDNATDKINPDKLAEQFRAERAGIVAWALEGACSLYWRTEYTTPPSQDGAKEEWRRETDSAYDFIKEKTKTTDGSDIPKMEVYRAYVGWCDSGGRRPVSYKVFCKRLDNAGVKSTRTKTCRYFANVELLAPGEQNTNEAD